MALPALPPGSATRTRPTWPARRSGSPVSAPAGFSTEAVRNVQDGSRSRRDDAPTDQRLSLITLGVADVSRARRFYEQLGWKIDGGVDDESDHVVFFQMPGMIVALWDRGKLAQDSCVSDPGGWGGVTLAYNTGSPEEVDRILDEARAAGAEIPRQGAATVWGGYSGIFVDLDGHPWEVAHNPRWTVHEDGSTTLD